jgi:hypothetical protein
MVPDHAPDVNELRFQNLVGMARAHIALLRNRVTATFSTMWTSALVTTLVAVALMFAGTLGGSRACAAVQCANGGTCSPLKDDRFECLCVSGYTGSFCESDIDDCTPASCDNGGTCLDRVNGFSCSCRPGYSGSQCELNLVREWGCWGVCEGESTQIGRRRRVSKSPGGIVDTKSCEVPRFPSWSNMSDVGRATFMDALGKWVAPHECRGSQVERTTIHPLPNVDTDDGLYEESVLAPNGRIYFPPCIAQHVLVLDPSTNKLEYVGPELGAKAAIKYRGAVLGLDGFVYGIPSGVPAVLQINPRSNEVTRFGHVNVNRSNIGMWTGGVLAPSGIIYGMPNDAHQILRINPMEKTVRLFGTLKGNGAFAGGVLSPNGRIYGIPWRASQILVIDPKDDSLSYVDCGSPEDGQKWAFGVLGLQGTIYGLPATADSILVFDPNANTKSKIKAYSGLIGGAMGPNGLVYLAPTDDHGGVFALDTASVTVSIRVTGSFSGYRGGTLAPNGAIYFSPWRGSSGVLQVDFPFLPTMAMPLDALLSPLLT